MNYTKGNWIVHPHAKTNVIEEQSGRVVASCGGYMDFSNGKQTHEENLANTQLISASKEMYERLCEVYDEGLDDGILMEDIDKTLKKAEGKL